MTDALNVVITAATSAAGREAVRQFAARGHRVTGLTVGSDGGALVRGDGGIPAYSDPLRAGELKSILHMAQADVVVQLMTQEANSFPLKDGRWERYARVLSEGTDALLEAAAGAGVKHIVFTSYTFVYGDTHGEWVTEDSTPHGNGLLRAARQAEEKVLKGGLSACVLRAGTVYGPGDPATDALAEAVRRGRAVYLGDSHAVMNWIHAADLARAALLAAEQQPAGQIFNIVDDHPASASEFAAYLGESLGVGAPAAVRAPEFRLNQITDEMQRVLLSRSAKAKNDKAKSALGWTPKYPTLRAGLDQTLLHWRAKA